MIIQGGDGDYFYVIDQGELDCYKKYSKKPEPTFLKTYQPGESFGELALLYNAPRAASITAKTDSVLFGLDRDCFNNIVKEAACKKRERYEAFLKGLEIFKDIDPYFATKIADGLNFKEVKAGDVIIAEGSSPEFFWFVEKGECEAIKKREGEEPKVLYTHPEGDYFGETSFLMEVDYDFSVVAKVSYYFSVLIYLGRFYSP